MRMRQVTAALIGVILPAFAEAEPAYDYRVPERRDDGIAVADLTTLSCDQDALINVVDRMEKDNPGAVCSLLIAKDRRLVVEHYFGEAGIDTLHPQRSITKSVTSYALGKAIELGAINSVDDPILDYFPEVSRAAVAPGVEKITIKDCLTMQSGLRYNKKELAGKRFTQKTHIPWILEEWTRERITEEPIFRYSYSDPVIISHLLYNATGKTVAEYAYEHLFQPMGIEQYKFRQMSCGMTYAVDGMELRSRDTLKLGLMTLNGGVWNGKRILNEEYINEATAAHAVAGALRSYGYFWWVPAVTVDGTPCPTKMAFGAGGQVIYIVPEQDLVVVFTAEKASEQKLLREILQEEIIPAFH